MLGTLSHRGPDDEGIYSDPDHDVMLGQRRLAIIDLSPSGHQPMQSEDGSLSLTYNGEIYNYKELGAELAALGQTFRSTSDTEVILNGYAQWGEDIFRRIDGMWALALYDRKEQRLLLSRDPSGIKPLYLYEKDNALYFASEIAALKAALPDHALTLRESSMDRFLAHGYLYGTETAYTEINRLPAGTVRSYSLGERTHSEASVYDPQKRFAPQSMSEAVATFDELFSESVRATLQSDVPVGLFLSGGIDSALVGYHIKATGASLTAFTVGFAEEAFDESAAAARIAKHLGFPHVTHVMNGSDVANDIERILDSYGEPFADTSALPTYYVSKLAREHGIKVALDGSGADELFGGYPTHYLPPFAEAYRRTPHATDALLRQAVTLLPGGFTKLGSREKLTRFLDGARNPYRDAHAQWKRLFTKEELHALVRPDSLHSRPSTDVSFKEYFARIASTSTDSLDEAMKVDFLTFLPGSCLVKSDIASMQHGLELRVPFLNKNLIDFAWYLPRKYKVGPFSTKRILRQALRPHLPADITRMKKQGFVPPLAQWLTQELKPAMLSMLSQEQVAAASFLEYKYIVSLMDDHLELRSDNSKKIWALMSLVRFLNANPT
jgi:asparagine synthase (glutamine-hydrolysing)